MMLPRLALILACGLALAAPSLAGDNPPPAGCIGPTCGGIVVPFKPAAPEARWITLGAGELRDQTPWSRDNRIFYARTLSHAARWLPFIQRSDRRALQRLNFSEYGVLAVFHVTTTATISLANVTLMPPDGLNAILAVDPCCQGPPLPPGPAPFVPPIHHHQYLIARIDKDSLPQPVRQLYIIEVTEDP